MRSQNPMPLIDQARHTWRNRMNGDPSATDAMIVKQIEALKRGQRTGNRQVVTLLQIEIDRLEMLL